MVGFAEGPFVGFAFGLAEGTLVGGEVAQQYPWPMYLVTSHVLAPAAVAVAEPLPPSDGHPVPPGVPWKVRPNQDWPELVLSKASKLEY